MFKWVSNRYLGVPLAARRLTVMEYRGLIDRITTRITGWNAKFLSYAGHLQVIRSILCSILIYWVQMFYLPSTVIDEIEKRCRLYLWTGYSMQSHRVLVGWNDVCTRKKEGGLGIRHIKIWNIAFLFKNIWTLEMKL